MKLFYEFFTYTYELFIAKNQVLYYNIVILNSEVLINAN